MSRRGATPTSKALRPGWTVCRPTPFQHFDSLPNMERVWRKTMQVGEGELTVVAVETKG